MSTTRFDSLLKTWLATPISITGKNANGKLWGDDSGYRNMRTLAVNPAPLVTPDNIVIRPIYDAVCAYTGGKTDFRLKGGLRNAAFVLREAAARSVALGGEFLRQISGGMFEFVGFDAFRSGPRQIDGYTHNLRLQMQAIGLTDDDVNADRRIAEFLACSMKADGVFSWVKVAQDAVYEQLIAEIRGIPAIVEGAEAFIAENPGFGSVDDALYEYVIACRNSGLGYAAKRGTLVWENNAHAGGGAIDLMILVNGVLKALTPFDYPGFLSAYDFAEKDENYDVYLKVLKGDSWLQDHLRRCGYDPNNFTFAKWKELRDIKRVQYHLGRACGWTFYSMGSHGGEHWHEEPGNLVVDPRTGTTVWAEPQTGAQYPHRGNPGHSLQKFGPDDLAVWGAKSAHEIAIAEYGLSV